MTDERSRRRWSRPAAAAALSAEVVRSFYVRPIAWASLLVSSAFLTYGGGAAMFWVHAVLRGEAGPAIDNVHHWLLDSTLGFLALTPVLALLLPLAVWQAGGGTRRTGRARLWVYVLAVAIVFTLFTGPGPLMHDAVAGRGTPLADLATRVFGEHSAAIDVMHPKHSPMSKGLLQLGAGLPVYLACTWLSLHIVRAGARLTRRSSAARSGISPERAGAVRA